MGVLADSLQFKGTWEGICVFVFLFFIYIYKGMGDSSGKAIPEEWQLICNLREIFFIFICVFFYLYLQGDGGLLWQCNSRGVAVNLQFKGHLISFFFTRGAPRLTPYPLLLRQNKGINQIALAE